jgi:hypothetical protein
LKVLLRQLLQPTEGKQVITNNPSIAVGKAKNLQQTSKQNHKSSYWKDYYKNMKMRK